MAPAKINLFLLITGRREDGYHLLYTLFQKISLHDEILLSAETGKRNVLVECPGSSLPHGKENLVYRAAMAFMDVAGRDMRVRITLHKKIPVGGGLGGGSSDAASVLAGMNELSGFPLADADLYTVACRLGADVPFFLLKENAAIGRGTGTELKPFSTAHRHFLLVQPEFSVSTRWAYENYVLTTHDEDTIFVAEDADNTENWCNDLESVVVGRYPEIEQIKSFLVQAGAEVALMSGSGSTVFGAFSAREDAEVAESFFENKKGLKTFLAESLSD